MEQRGLSLQKRGADDLSKIAGRNEQRIFSAGTETEPAAGFAGEERLCCASGWYNDHYQKNADGEWVREAFPIPVISVKGICDIEIQFDGISVTAKRKREDALAYDYSRLAKYPFEAYGVEEYLSDYCHPGQSEKEMKDQIGRSGEKEIGFSFGFAYEAEELQIAALVNLLAQEGFFY